MEASSVLRQIAWCCALGMVKGDFNPTELIDIRHVIPPPEHRPQRGSAHDRGPA